MELMQAATRTGLLTQALTEAVKLCDQDALKPRSNIYINILMQHLQEGA